MFWVRSVYYNVRNILLKSDTFPLGHPVYIDHHHNREVRWDRSEKKKVAITYNFVTKELTPTAVTSGGYVADGTIIPFFMLKHNLYDHSFKDDTARWTELW